MSPTTTTNKCGPLPYSSGQRLQYVCLLGRWEPVCRVQNIYTTTELLVLAGCTAQVLYKPRAVKMQKEAALEGGPGGRNYNPEALEASKLRSLKLDGTRVALRADFCLMALR